MPFYYGVVRVISILLYIHVLYFLSARDTFLTYTIVYGI